jgi:hypothetical protein
LNNEFEHGHVEFELAGVTYQADFAVVGGLIQLSLLDRKVVIGEQLPGATYQESAIHVLEQFAVGKIRPRD